MTEKQVVKDQHFVPAFYLRRFTNGDGFLERLVLPDAKVLPSSRKPEKEANDLFFYGVKTGEEDEISQDVEEFWKNVEDFIAPKLDAVVEKIVQNKQLSPFDEEVVALLAAMLYMRTPHFRETMNHNMGKLEKQLYQMRAGDPRYTDHLLRVAKSSGMELTQERAEEVREFILGGEYDLVFTNAPHLRFMITEFEGFRNMFYGAKWRFYIAKGERQFVTSSAPCIEVFPEKWDFFYGPSFYQRGHFLPLGPNVLAEAISPFGPGKRVKRMSVDDDQVFSYNIQQANWSHIPDQPRYSRCYATRKTELQELIENRERRPGNLLLKAVARKVAQGL
jgi:hypothetical protein